MISELLMGLGLWVLALIGGYSVAGIVGISVVLVFLVTQTATAVQRARTPKARFLRHLGESLQVLDYDEDTTEITITEITNEEN